MKKTKFPFQHIVLEDKKEVWILCDSAITAMGIGAIVKQYYPGYTAKIISEKYYHETVRKLSSDRADNPSSGL